jgi:hypothetical protein
MLNPQWVEGTTSLNPQKAGNLFEIGSWLKLCDFYLCHERSQPIVRSTKNPLSTSIKMKQKDENSKMSGRYDTIH